MKLGSTRTLEGLRPVLKNPASTGPENAYFVITEISEGLWFNTTITAPGRYGEEYPKTYGHYHPVDAKDEVYRLIEGEGIFLMQKKLLDSNGEWIREKVEAVVLIKAKPGDEIVIKPEWGHSWSNIGETPLITFDNWKYGHSPADYEVIEKLRGMAYYLVEGENNQPQALPNPSYKDLPEAQWLTAEEFKQKYG